MRLLLVSGGSGGHLAPMVAVGRAFGELHPEAEMLYLCVDQEADRLFLQREHVMFDVLPLPRRSVSLPITFIRNFLKSRRMLRTFRPDIVFSKGGAVSVPCCLAARLRKIPIVLHESDAVMGRANRIVARIADVVCVGMTTEVMSDGDSTLKTQNSKLVFTGNPIRPEITRGSRAEGLRITGLSGKKPILLVYGGSQGAQALNDAVITHIDQLLPHCDIIHLTGKGKQGAGVRAGYVSMEFAYGELAHFYAIADLAVSRAGASNIGELAAHGIPAILVPIAGLAGDHQVKNAETAALSGGCIHLPQSRADAEIVPTIVALVDDANTREKMGVFIRALSHPEAARRIAKILSQRIASARVAH